MNHRLAARAAADHERTALRWIALPALAWLLAALLASGLSYTVRDAAAPAAAEPPADAAPAPVFHGA
jgi:hypothetical protein